ATISSYGTLSGIISPDVVSLNTTGASANFADANAGPGKTVAVTGLALGGAAAANYSIGSQATTANINQATPTVSATWSGWTYDGTAHAASGSVTGVGGANLGAATSFTYYVGAGTGGTNLGSTPPKDAGTYTAVAHYAGSTNYTAADSS